MVLLLDYEQEDHSIWLSLSFVVFFRFANLNSCSYYESTLMMHLNGRNQLDLNPLGYW